jgi:hypothetical protein
MADEPLQGHIKPSGHINKQFARWEARERGGWQYLARDRREFITLLGGVVSVFLCVSAAAQEGYYTEWATINGIKASIRSSKEMTAKAHAAI